ncbi:hypothetical protein QBC47DRAFT_402044 [Echria macrotheca]|uniref:Uncharacterized protein n=1 Tax=Echria macrotheca TaxID=438768 RepID=A0AAJ0FC68_9PEZI|nr:hypothetical protein QBC47DRAFT_402044 [Echria macrotheca]
MPPSLTHEEFAKIATTPDYTIHAPLWHAALEQQLQDSWEASDDKCLDENTKSMSGNEIWLWREVAQVFRASLRDLFRYGLRIDTAASDPPVPYMNRDLCKKLRLVVCHPFWAGDLSLLRYALQWAISAEQDFLPHAIDPFPKLSPALLAGMKDWAHESDMLANVAMAKDLVGMLRPLQRMPRLQDLCNLIEKNTPRHHRHKREYFLRVHHVSAVIKSLDQLNATGSPCVYHADQFREAMSGAPHRYPPHPTVLRALKKDWVLGERRLFAMATRYHMDNKRADDEYLPLDAPAGEVPALPRHMWSRPQQEEREQDEACYLGYEWVRTDYDPPYYMAATPIKSASPELSDQDLDTDMPDYDEALVSDQALDPTEVVDLTTP